MRSAALLILLASLSFSVSARAVDPDQAKKVYRGLAKTFPQRKIFYRWQSRASGLTLLRSGTFDEKLQKYFMGMKFNSGTMHGGRGIYVAETLYTSSRFIRGNAEGSLIEVVVDAGTPYIDLEDPEVLRKLNAAGLKGTPAELAEIEPNLIVRYRQADVNSAKDWWVIKSPRGVRFQRFNPNRFTLDELRTVYEKIARYGDREDIRVARQVLVSRLTDEQRLQLGWKKTYFHDIATVIKYAVAPVHGGRTATADEERFFNEMIERSDETADELAKHSLESARFLEHPGWNEASLTKMMKSFFLRRRDVGSSWTRNWVALLVKHRSRLLPIFDKNEGLGKAMIQHLHQGSSRYSSDRDRELVRIFRESSPEGLEQLAGFYLAGKTAAPEDFVDLAETFQRGLRSREFEEAAVPLLRKLRVKFSLDGEQTKIVDRLVPPSSPAIAEMVLTDAQKIEAFFESLEKSLREVPMSTWLSTDVQKLWIDPFVSLRPSGEQLKRLEKRINKQSFAKSLRNAAFPAAQSAAQFVDYAGSAFDRGNEDYLRLLDDAVAENIARFLSLKPTDDELVALAGKLHVRNSDTFSRMASVLVNAAKDPTAFASRIQYERCLATLRKQ